MNRTHGGFPEYEALHWNDETRQQLGQIVFLLVAGNGKKAKQGYIEFYQLKRQFMAEEFDGFVSQLDAHRKSKCFPLLRSMVDAVAGQIVAAGDTVDFYAQPVGPVEVPVAAPVELHELVIVPHQTPLFAVEQMSLFG